MAKTRAQKAEIVVNGQSHFLHPTSGFAQAALRYPDARLDGGDSRAALRFHAVRSAFVDWLRGQDSNLPPSGYEPDELPGCSTPTNLVGRAGECPAGNFSAEINPAGQRRSLNRTSVRNGYAARLDALPNGMF